MSTLKFEGIYPSPTTLYRPIVAHTSSSDMAAHQSEDFLLPGLETGDLDAAFNSPLAFADSGLSSGPGAYSSDASGTVSPKDLIFPPSATYTELSTPSFASPGSYSQGPSPMFQEVDATHLWDDPLLFGDSTGLLESPASGEVPMAQALGGRFAGSPPPKPVVNLASPISATGSGKISSVAGITKRAASKPLAPVQFDPADAEAARRARNTEAARKSRAKKAEALASAERRAEDAESRAEALMEELAKVKAELARLKA